MSGLARVRAKTVRRRHLLPLAVALLGIALLAVPFASQRAARAQEPPTPGALPAVPGPRRRPALPAGRVRVIISLPGRVVPTGPPAIRAAERAALARAQDVLITRYRGPSLTVGQRYRTVPAFAATVSTTVLNALRLDPSVVSVILDTEHVMALPEGRALIRADDVHIAGVTGAGVTAAVIDTGADRDHPDLVDDLVGGKCFSAPDGCPGNVATGDGLVAAEDHCRRRADRDTDTDTDRDPDADTDAITYSDGFADTVVRRRCDQSPRA